MCCYTAENLNRKIEMKYLAAIVIALGLSTTAAACDLGLSSFRLRQSFVQPLQTYAVQQPLLLQQVVPLQSFKVQPLVQRQVIRQRLAAPVVERQVIRQRSRRGLFLMR